MSKRQGYWDVEESHILALLIQWRRARQWLTTLANNQVHIPELVIYDPTMLILQILAISPGVDETFRHRFIEMIYRFEGETVADMNELFTAILDFAHPKP